ncbi:MAG TPA: hypothetical protein VFB04_05635 [Terriglobales bacterium]|nr:hypothetical protein [Terriglobales bacterium]
MLTANETMHDQRSPFVGGFALLWRRQGIFWWIFAVNLICAALGTLPGFLRLHNALGQTLASQPLTNRFDLGVFVELIRLPEVDLMRFTTSSYMFALVFFVFMVFVTGGVLETYRDDRRLTTGEFFAASGAYFWRIVRLLLLSIVPFVIVTMIYQALQKFSDHAGDRAIADQVGIFLGLASLIVFLLLALFVRLWFDIAQVRAVGLNQRGMWRNTWRAWSISWHRFGRLYGMYFAIALLAWIATAIGLVIWAELPATATGAMFILFELIMLAQIAGRLWQLAGASIWYRQYAEVIAPAVIEAAPLPLTADVEHAPEPIHEPARPAVGELGAETAPPKDPGPELPPADA